MCIMLPNSPEYPIIILGILTAGGYVTTVNPTYTVCKFFIYHNYEDKKTLACLSEKADVYAVTENSTILSTSLNSS